MEAEAAAAAETAGLAAPAPAEALGEGGRTRAYFPTAGGLAKANSAALRVQQEFSINPLFEDGTAKPSLILQLEASHQQALALQRELHQQEVAELEERQRLALQVGLGGRGAGAAIEGGAAASYACMLPKVL